MGQALGDPRAKLVKVERFLDQRTIEDGCGPAGHEKEALPQARIAPACIFVQGLAARAIELQIAHDEIERDDAHRLERRPRVVYRHHVVLCVEHARDGLGQ